MKYLATVNVPGYMPTDDDPPVFDTVAEAWWHHYHERINDENQYECELCHNTLKHGVFGDCDSDSETAENLGKMARLGQEGTIYSHTPGYEGDHDLGLAYCVTAVEEGS